eukprot:57435_1
MYRSYMLRITMVTFYHWVLSTYNGKDIRKQPRYGHPSKNPRRVIESLFRDMSGNNHLNVVPATQQKAKYDEYVKQVNELVSQYDDEERKVFLPSEMWVSDEVLSSLRASDDAVDFGEGLSLKESDWSDENIEQIMKGRGKISCEYLSLLGQEVRHEFVDGIMFQLVSERLYENSSHYRMHKYVILRAVTEIILEEHGVDIRKYSVHIDEAMNEMKQEIRNGLLEFCDTVKICLKDLVHPTLSIL